ncbi:MAG TPA: MBL fold metallo-hydrolase [bacterium]|nr:MBL fold metallo-hydrolase [bacterium]
MQIHPWVHLVGSDQFGLTAPNDSNIYLLDGGTALAIVDVGRLSSFDDMIANVRASGYDPARVSTIFLTHEHTGHSEGCARFKDQFGAKLVAHRNSAPSLATGANSDREFMRAYGAVPPGYEFPTVSPDVVIDDGWTTSIGRFRVRAVHVRGHTEDSVCYVVDSDDSRAIFTGDVVFFNGMVGLLNLPGCNLGHYRADIQKLGDLNVDQLFPGHGIFVLKGAQLHLDMAVQQFRRPHLPESYYEGIKRL